MVRQVITDGRTRTVVPGLSTGTRTVTPVGDLLGVLNRKRSQRYIRAMTTLDAGGHHSTRGELQSIIDTIHHELPELDIEELPIGIVARCYLGAPFEVHTLHLTGDIIRHYETYTPLPPDLEKARSLSLHPHYALVEVYRSGEMRAVMDNGDVVLIGGKPDVV